MLRASSLADRWLWRVGVLDSQSTLRVKPRILTGIISFHLLALLACAPWLFSWWTSLGPCRALPLRHAWHQYRLSSASDARRVPLPALAGARSLRSGCVLLAGRSH
jgi:hypothetical protein